MNIPIFASDNARQRLLLEQVANRLPELTLGGVYSLAAIVGHEFWDEVDAPHKALGRSFHGLVEKARVPFIDAGLTSSRHNRYRFTGWKQPTYPAPETHSHQIH